MGIPSYFSYLVRNHPDVLRRLLPGFKCANLYMDCNSLVYDAVHQLPLAGLEADAKVDAILQHVVGSIETHVQLLQPHQNVFLAFDGVAPVAKLEQQRGRRYKSMYTQRVLGTNDAFNTTAITPGTRFMQRLNETMYQRFARNEQQLGVKNIMVSGSDEAGEGEHKLFAYLRDHPDEHRAEVGATVIYGLDADLIMLSLHHLPAAEYQLFLYRETPHFIQSIDATLEANAAYLLDIPRLGQAVVQALSKTPKESTPKERASSVGKQPLLEKKSPSDDLAENRLHDYIFLCFLLGNDFLPHFPAVNIRTGGITKLLQAYNATMTGDDCTLTCDRGTRIRWDQVRRLILFLAKHEETWIKDEKKMRDKQARSLPFTEDPAVKLDRLPLVQRDTEHYINPFQAGWQNRYYRSLFGIVQFDDARRSQICGNYLAGLEWTLRYYTSGCCDYRWRYHYLYPPLLEDLQHVVPFFDMTHFPAERIIAPPIAPLVQLCYVLPRASLPLLPPEIVDRMDPAWHPDDCAFVWAYCKFFWESHVELPELDLTRLEQVCAGFRTAQLDAPHR